MFQVVEVGTRTKYGVAAEVEYRADGSVRVWHQFTSGEGVWATFGPQEDVTKW